MVRIALFQSQTGIDPAANAERLVEAIGQAAEGGAAIQMGRGVTSVDHGVPERAPQNDRRAVNEVALPKLGSQSA